MYVTRQYMWLVSSNANLTVMRHDRGFKTRLCTMLQATKTKKQTVLEMLTEKPTTVRDISAALSVSESAARSLIGDLTRAGHRVSASGTGVDRRYHATPEPQRRGIAREVVSREAKAPHRDARGCAQLLLETLQSMGGAGFTAEVRQALENRLRSKLSADDMRLFSNRVPAWWNRFNLARQALIATDLMKGDSPRGYWELTGHQR